ncbi:hypothetical protein BofuT4_uP093590.1 [Botrytis cinerea T4]|uniref:Uncharacterized protein n=1 Tax=Botryotinia fuckeliana (strain T4) TaxID=999810 RepID=G2YE89_BOTF4|nr:hypothetical protein BofuT4_uP093590.1 [Botrytis cinerea T4]
MAHARSFIFHPFSRRLSVFGFTVLKWYHRQELDFASYKCAVPYEEHWRPPFAQR